MADSDEFAVDAGLGADAWTGPKFRRGQGCVDEGGDHARNRMFRSGFDGSGERDDAGRVLVLTKVIPRKRHSAFGDGAGLVQQNRRDLLGPFESGRAAKQDAELGSSSGRDEQCGWDGEAECARAGDDEHCNGRGEGFGE